MDLRVQGTQLQSLLGLRSPPVAVAFKSAPPPNVQRISEPGPAGCSYWKLAADGQIFFTEASDHYACPIGAHTHGVELPEEAVQELQGLVETMVGLEYIQMEEVPKIPRRRIAFGVAIYAPLIATPVEPDVVLVQGNPKQVMLLAEAVRAAQVGDDMGIKLRPTCAIVPEAAEAGHVNLSLGCIGNRVYTGLGDDEVYCALPASKMAAVLDRLENIIAANRELEMFHHQRKSAP